MKRLSLLRGICISAIALLCAALPVAATTAADLAIADPIVVATEPEEIDEKIYYYQDDEKVAPEEFTWVAGKTGKAVKLNGNNQYLRYSAEKTLQLEEFTFSAFVNLGGEDGNIGQKLLTVYKNESMFITVAPHILDTERAIDGIYMEWQDREIDPVVMYTDPGADTTFALEAGAWHHVAVVVSDTEFSMYLDGIRFYSVDMDTSFSAMELNTFLIGGGFYGEPLLNALLDDAYIYPQALEAPHVALLAAGLDPADGGTPPTTTTYRPTAPSVQATVPSTPSDTPLGVSPMVLILPIAIITIIVVLSIVLSSQKKRLATEGINDGEAGDVLSQPETPIDAEDEESETVVPDAPSDEEKEDEQE